MSVSIRFANQEEACEYFIGFIRLEKLNAQLIVNALITKIKEWGLDLSCLVGQGMCIADRMCCRYPYHLFAKIFHQYVIYLTTFLVMTWFLSGSVKRKAVFNEANSSSDNTEVLHSLFGVDTEDGEGVEDQT